MKNKEGKKAWNQLSQNLDDLKEGFEKGDFSNEFLEKITPKVDELELAACKAKINFELGVLKRKGISLTAMEALLQVLSLLPKELSPELIKQLTDYILAEWVSGEQRLAA